MGREADIERGGLRQTKLRSEIDFDCVRLRRRHRRRRTDRRVDFEASKIPTQKSLVVGRCLRLSSVSSASATVPVRPIEDVSTSLVGIVGRLKNTLKRVTRFAFDRSRRRSIDSGVERARRGRRGSPVAGFAYDASTFAAAGRIGSTEHEGAVGRSIDSF